MNKFPVMEHFYTLQGEGKFAGQAAYFIRLGGCDVGCVWCDVKESWDALIHPQLTVAELVNEVKKTPAQIVVVTGGEPAMYDLGELTNSLRKEGFRTHIETSGAYAITGEWDWVTFSPKKFKSPVEDFGKVAHELKVIVFNKSDLKWAEMYKEQVSSSCELYLQPEWDKEKEMSAIIVDYIKEHPQWSISIQTHKYLNIP